MGYIVEDGEKATVRCPLCKSTIRIIGSADATDDVVFCPYCGGNLMWLDLHGPSTLKEAIEKLEETIALWKQESRYDVELSQQLQHARSALIYHWEQKKKQPPHLIKI